MASSQRHLAGALAADIVTPDLHHMTALEASPMDFVPIAREVGAPSVCAGQ